MSEQPKVRVDWCDDEQSWIVVVHVQSRRAVIEFFDDGDFVALITDGEKNKVISLEDDDPGEVVQIKAE